MICLVINLTNPLFFWRILVYYNPTSVMSIGVMALLFYIPLVFVLMCVVLQQEITSVSWLKWLDPIISFAKSQSGFGLDRSYPCDCDLCLHRARFRL